MKYFFYFSFLTTMLLLTSCESEIASKIDGLPFRSTEDGKWGLVTPDGKIIFEEDFKDCPTAAHNGLFMVKNGQGLWEIYTADSNPQKIGDEYIQIGNFTADVAPAVKKDEKISLINKTGEVVATLDKAGSKNIIGVSNFSYGYAIFQAGEDFGIIDTKGNVVIPAKYSLIAPVPEGKFVALESKYKNEETKNSVLTILDSQGNTLSSIKLSKYDEIGTFDQIIKFGCIPVKVTADGESQWGIINLNGDQLLKPSGKIRQLGEVAGENFTYNDGNAWGVKNLKDEIIIRAKYTALTWASDNLLWAFEDNNGHSEWSLIDLNGTKITKDTYIDVLPFFDGEHAAVKISDKSWGFIDKQGNELKNTPDIYEIMYSSADEWLESDFIDFDAIVSDLKMTEKSMGEYGLDMPNQQIAKIYAENNYEEGKERIKATPDGIGLLNTLSYKKTIEGASVTYTLGYAPEDFITTGGISMFDEKSLDWITTNATWSNAKPAYISVSISGDKIKHRTKDLFSRVAARLKSTGKVFKENKNALIVSISNGQRGYVAYNNGRTIEIALFASDGYKTYSIDQFETIQESIEEDIKNLEGEIEAATELIEEGINELVDESQTDAY